MVDDVIACSVLLDHGIAAPVIRGYADALLQDDLNCSSGQYLGPIGCILQSLSRSADFVTNVCRMPEDVGALVSMAKRELQMAASATAGASFQLSCFECLCNMCRAAPHACFTTLARSGIIEMLSEALQQLQYTRQLQAAEALCRLIDSLSLDDSEKHMLPASAFYYVALPGTIRVLIDIAIPKDTSRLQDRWEKGRACQLFRHRLPWLLAVVAQAPVDLKLWCEESVGVRRLLNLCLSGCSRDAVVWALDVLAAMCGRVSAVVLSEFLLRTPNALVEQWSQLVHREHESVLCRVLFVGFFCAVFLPDTGAAMEALSTSSTLLACSSLPWRSESSSKPLGLAPAQRRMAELVVETVLELNSRNVCGHAFRTDEGHFLNVFLAAAGFDAFLTLQSIDANQRGYSVGNTMLPQRQRLTSVLAVLQGSLQAVCQATGRLAHLPLPTLGRSPSSIIALLTSILDGPLTNQPGCAYHEIPFEETGHAAHASSQVQGAISTASNMLEEILFQQPPDSQHNLALRPLLVLQQCAYNSGNLGRFLARLILRAFSCQEGSSKADSATPWEVVNISLEKMASLDLELRAASCVMNSSVPSQSCLNEALVQNWTVTLLATSELNFQELCHFMAFCSLFVANATLQCLANNLSGLAKEGLHLSVWPLKIRSHALALLEMAVSRFGHDDDHCSSATVHFNLLVLQLLFTAPQCRSSRQPSAADANMFAEMFAYLWSQVQVACLDTSPCCMLLKLREDATNALQAFLHNRDVVHVLSQSEDNASCLGVLRQVLRGAGGKFPLFSPVEPGAAILDLSAETWTPPGRVLFATLIHLWRLHRQNSVTTCEGVEPLFRLLCPVLRAAVYTIALCARPADLFVGPDDVKSVLQVAAQLVVSPPTDLVESDPGEWQRLGGELLVPLLHRPTLVEMLNAPVGEVLRNIEQGREALEWCASFTLSGAGLTGGFGAKARSLLGSLATDSFEDAGDNTHWKSCSELSPS